MPGVIVTDDAVRKVLYRRWGLAPGMGDGVTGLYARLVCNYGDPVARDAPVCSRAPDQLVGLAHRIDRDQQIDGNRIASRPSGKRDGVGTAPTMADQDDWSAR